MNIIRCQENQNYVSHIDECAERNILLIKIDLPSSDIDRYFRIVLDRDGADWNFVLPYGYRNIIDKDRRIAAFYADGFAVISEFLSLIGYFVDIKIPKRYRRYFDTISEGR